MGAPPLAFSVHHFISSVGADAGFAAIIGLAILVLLFFAQARETTALRDRVQELLGRIGELEAKLSRVASAQATQAAQAEAAAAQGVQVAPPPAALRAVAGGRSASVRLAALELPPFPPAGVAAPALTAATRVIPAGVAARAAAARVPVGVAAAGDETRPAPVAAAASPTVTGPAPATAAGATNGASHAATAPAPQRAGGAGPGPRPAAAARQGAPAGPSGRRPAAPGALPRHLAIKPERSRASRIGLVLLALALVAAVAAAVLLITQGKSPSSPSSAAGRRTAASSHTAVGSRARAGTAVNPATVTVSVVNGTTTNHLATKTANTLVADGFRKGTVSTASDQTHPTTVVYYVPGHAAAAQAVAQKLRLSSGAIRPIDPATRQVAFYSDCTAPPCIADVVVLLGADLANR